jgi:hypothetical protein
MTTTATASGIDPTFSLIEAHQLANAAHYAAIAEQTRLDSINDPAAEWITEAPCCAANDAFNELIGTAPRTIAGLRAWAAYLDGFNNSDDAWMFEEEGPTLVATFAQALGNLAA